MKKVNLLMMSIAFLMLIANVNAQSKLEVVSEFPNARPGNVAVSNDGRVFVTMSALGSSKYMVKEILPDGSTKPFPDKGWIVKPEGKSIKGINKTIGIQTDDNNTLWVLDMGNPQASPKQAPKLMGWDISTQELIRVFPIPEAIADSKSFLQDFIIDEKHNVAVLADMTDALNPPFNPAFVVINLKTGHMRRVLENHESLMPVDEPVVVNGRPISHKYADGTTMQPRYPLNPISNDSENNFIYYGAMGGKKIYRIPASVMADEKLTDSEMSEFVSYYAEKPKSDGFKIGHNGEVYVTDVEGSAIAVCTPEGSKILVADKKLLSFPDGLAVHKNYLYIVVNQLHNLPVLNEGKDTSNPPYYVLRTKIK